MGLTRQIFLHNGVRSRVGTDVKDFDFFHLSSPSITLETLHTGFPLLD